MQKTSDLSPDEPRRRVYASMCQLVLRHTDYTEHLHRFKVTFQNKSNEPKSPIDDSMQDLERCFIRILSEENETEDKRTVNEIINEIAAFETLR